MSKKIPSKFQVGEEVVLTYLRYHPRGRITKKTLCSRQGSSFWMYRVRTSEMSKRDYYELYEWKLGKPGEEIKPLVKVGDIIKLDESVGFTGDGGPMIYKIIEIRPTSGDNQHYGNFQYKIQWMVDHDNGYHKHKAGEVDCDNQGNPIWYSEGRIGGWIETGLNPISTETFDAIEISNIVKEATDDVMNEFKVDIANRITQEVIERIWRRKNEQR